MLNLLLYHVSVSVAKRMVQTICSQLVVINCDVSSSVSKSVKIDALSKTVDYWVAIN